ncbi:MAG: histidine kinase, partial [Bacteroidetes bacterium]|nr:histidine kinase [Bacteroidota bacterium]
STNDLLLLDKEERARDIAASLGIVRTNPLFFYETADGRCWLYYNGGLLRFHWDAAHLPVREQSITSADGLPNEAIRSLTIDPLGRIWAVTSAGLVVIETDSAGIGKPIVHRLSEELGVTYNLWIQTRLLTDDDGNIWMNFMDAVYRFNPRLVLFDNTPPSVSIENIQLNGQAADWRQWSDSLYGYRQLPHIAWLPWSLNNLSISFKAPCFNGSSGIEYSWSLDGEDSSWSKPDANASVSFVRLPPNSYRFKVRARKSNTAWGEPAVFVFSIRKPWWQTWWFRLLIVLLGVAALAFLFQLRLQRVRRKAQVREQLQQLELKALRLQMNPHFIYNALNSIQALVLDNKAEEASFYISRFGRLLRQVLNHSEKVVITLQEELEALELYLQLEQLRLNFDLRYHISVSPGVNALAETLPPLVLQPFAENAVWHGLSRKQGEKNLFIMLSVEGPWLIADIRDDGIGRGAESSKKTDRMKHPSRGIGITSRRMDEYNGHSPSITITDLHDINGRPAGTQVRLRIRRKTQSGLN